ncbi:hypothetical protein WJX84_008328 [Apatococcus fuscideae]|uniref:Uncharacterized protein n=1 Tax=Apatococcus fuscideae TaxID=2026836 RepID=A0AAW1T6D9_9CHLO
MKNFIFSWSRPSLRSRQPLLPHGCKNLDVHRGETGSISLLSRAQLELTSSTRLAAQWLAWTYCHSGSSSKVLQVREQMRQAK